MEAARGTIPVCRMHGKPEKVGQLIAGLFRGSGQVYQIYEEKEFSPQGIAVKGALEDKTNVCVLKIDVNGGTSVDCTYVTTSSIALQWHPEIN